MKLSARQIPVNMSGMCHVSIGGDGDRCLMESEAAEGGAVQGAPAVGAVHQAGLMESWRFSGDLGPV